MVVGVPNHILFHVNHSSYPSVIELGDLTRFIGYLQEQSTTPVLLVQLVPELSFRNALPLQYRTAANAVGDKPLEVEEWVMSIPVAGLGCSAGRGKKRRRMA